MRRMATSWTGSERLRRPQIGVCLPPSRPPNRAPRFSIPAGTTVAISKITPNFWFKYLTKRDLGFERWESYEAGRYVFREQGYFVQVDRRHVVHRGQQ